MKSCEFKLSEREIVVVAHNIRSIMNIGSILRSCEGFGIEKVFATGYTPNIDNGLPHVRAKLAKELHKTALGAEKIVDFVFKSDVVELIRNLSQEGFRIVGLEQDARSAPLPDYKIVSYKKIALILGEEVYGLTSELRSVCDDLVEIPMFGQKESFNVSVAVGIALYAFRAQ